MTLNYSIFRYKLEIIFGQFAGCPCTPNEAFTPLDWMENCPPWIVQKWTICKLSIHSIKVESIICRGIQPIICDVNASPFVTCSVINAGFCSWPCVYPPGMRVRIPQSPPGSLSELTGWLILSQIGMGDVLFFSDMNMYTGSAWLSRSSGGIRHLFMPLYWSIRIE